MKYIYLDSDIDDSSDLLIKNIRELEEETTIKINSSGGLVAKAVDLYEAILTNKNKINTEVYGIAGSSSGWLAMVKNGTRRIRSNAKIFVHNPMAREHDINTKNKDIKNTLLAYRDLICDIISKNSSLKKEEVFEMMNNNTWISAEDAVYKYKMFDELIPCNTVNIIDLVVNSYSNKINEKMNEEEKKKFEELIQSKDAEILLLKEEFEKNKNELELIKNKAELQTKTIAETVVNDVCNKLNISNENKPNLLAKCLEVGVENFKQIMSVVPEQKFDIRNHTEAKSIENGKTETEKDWAWYEKNSPDELNSMRIENKELYSKLKIVDELKYTKIK
jgi:ATP-dependent protease ClpP protease subunit